jgi:hypothetical protein
MSEPYVGMQACIPLDPEVHALARLWPADKPLFVVGGAVRDFVFAQLHGVSFQPKDYDLASELTAGEVKEILRRARVFFTTEGEEFGIITARPRGQAIEIASFRKEWYDPDTGGGRRPDRVQQGATPAADASRRDLYINALFYDIAVQEVRDYNGGQGLEDLRHRRVRVVGDPRERFREDRLRIPRFIRFFSRYNAGPIAEHLDEPTRDAIHHYKALPGVSAERKLAEFLAGLAQAISPAAYLRNLDAFGARPGTDELSLMEALFPGLSVNLDGIERHPGCTNPRAVLAWLLRDTDPAVFNHPRRGLGARLAFPSTLTDPIELMILVHRWGFDPEGALRMVKRRDKFHRKDMSTEEETCLRAEARADLADWRRLADYTPRQALLLEHFLSYQSSVRTQEFLDRGLKGRELGEALERAGVEAFRRSQEEYERRAGGSGDSP